MDFYIGPITDRVHFKALEKPAAVHQQAAGVFRRGIRCAMPRIWPNSPRRCRGDTAVSEVAGAALAPLFQKYGLPAPPVVFRPPITAATFVACQNAIPIGPPPFANRNLRT